MSSRAQLFIGRLPVDIRERDVQSVFEKYGRLLRCDVKFGMYGSTGGRRGGGGRTGMAYAFVDYEDKRDAEDAIKYENGREIRGQSIVVEWARGPSYRSGIDYRRMRGGGSGYNRNSNYRRENYGRSSSSRQNSEECYRCRRTGHWARDCPDSYYSRSSRHRSRSRSRSRSRNHRRSISFSRSRSRDRQRRSPSDYRQKSRSISRDKRVKPRSPSRSVSRSRSRSVDKSHKKPEKSKRSKHSPSKSMSRSRSPSKSVSRSPNYARKNKSPGKGSDNYDYAEKRAERELDQDRSMSRSPRKSISRSPSKENNRRYADESDRSVSRSKSR